MKFKEPFLAEKLREASKRDQLINSAITKLEEDLILYMRMSVSDRVMEERAKKLKKKFMGLSLNLYFQRNMILAIAKMDDRFFVTPYLNKFKVRQSRSLLFSVASNYKKSIEIAENIALLIPQYKKAYFKFNLKKKLLFYFMFMKLHQGPNQSSLHALTEENHLSYIVKKYFKHPKQLSIERKRLAEGDVIVSYKSSAFLRAHGISFLVALIEQSHFTHSSIVSSKEGDSIKVLNASGYKGHFGNMELTCEEGEYQFVFRPVIKKKEKLLLMKSIRGYVRRVSDKKQFFAYFKFFFALIEGFLYRFFQLIFQRIILIQNPFQRRTRYFCSEVVNKIFLDAEIFLTPRSLYSSLVGPVEIALSPHLKFIGVLSHKQK